METWNVLEVKKCGGKGTNFLPFLAPGAAEAVDPRFEIPESKKRRETFLNECLF